MGFNAIVRGDALRSLFPYFPRLAAIFFLYFSRAICTFVLRHVGVISILVLYIPERSATLAEGVGPDASEDPRDWLQAVIRVVGVYSECVKDDPDLSDLLVVE